MKTDFKTRFNIFLYGNEILYAMRLDALLRHIAQERFAQFTFERIATDEQADLTKDLDYLVERSFIKAFSDNHYQITKAGELKLASGGFTGEAKQSKNALYAFRISITAFLISLFHLVYSALAD